MHRTWNIMGNSASNSFVTSTPKTSSWGHQKDDTVNLIAEDDLWGVRVKPTLTTEPSASLTTSIMLI